MNGVFITLEGTDSAGKTTQSALFCKWLQTQKNLRVVQTREPGGEKFCEKIRSLVLNNRGLDGVTETLLMAAARREHILRRILPALQNGEWVICDRFSDSTFAYQGGGRGVPREWIGEVLREVEDGLCPDLTVYLRLPTQSLLNFSKQRKDAIEQRGDNFQRIVEESYKKLAEENPLRIAVVEIADANGARRPAEEIAAEIQNIITKRFKI
ncbi:MAG: dTMP kinase [Gammaproteobacteria bacterium]